MLADSDFALICCLVTFGVRFHRSSWFRLLNSLESNEVYILSGPESRSAYGKFWQSSAFVEKIEIIFSYFFRQVDAGPKAADASPPRLDFCFVKMLNLHWLPLLNAPPRGQSNKADVHFASINRLFTNRHGHHASTFVYFITASALDHWRKLAEADALHFTRNFINFHRVKIKTVENISSNRSGILSCESNTTTSINFPSNKEGTAFNFQRQTYNFKF